MAVKCTIRLDEIEYIDAQFVASHQKKTFSAYVANCVKMETQKRLKDIKKRIDEELHVYMLADEFQRTGNESESNSALYQLILEIVKSQLAGESE